MATKVIAPQTTIPANFGEGLAGIAPGLSAGGPPDLVTLLIENQTATAALDNATETSAVITIGFAQFAALGAGVKTADINLGGVLPTNARLLGPPTLEGFTGFDDPTHGAAAVIVGTSAGGNQIATTQSVAAGQTNFPKVMTAGVQGYPFAPQGGAQPSVRITTGADLNTLTAGAVSVHLFWQILP